MKTCKKCKKSVPNNLKICRYCGADVSKIKPNNKKKVNNNNLKLKTETLSKKEKVLKNLDATEILETKVIELEKTEVLETVVIDTKKIKEVKNRKVKKENKIEEPKEVVAEKIEEELSSFNTFDEKQKTKEKVTDLTKAQQIYVIKKKLKKKKINNFFVVIILLLSLGYIGYNFANNIDNFGHIVKGNEKIEEVSFNMGDMITYKDIKYVINSVEESTGTAYKKPKKNNIYLIVSLSLENKSNEKHHYSGKYFTMLNSKSRAYKRQLVERNLKNLSFLQKLFHTLKFYSIF